ncbi:MAG: hypothetical protein HKP52_03030, partial [Desulfofustis sp.]|nr:hypothetical protein [Desulfofustis sp.]
MVSNLRQINWMTPMITEYQKPETMRGKIVFFFWYNLPRFVFLAMMALILILFFSISEKYSDIKADQETAIKQERPPINTVVMEGVPTTISNRINLPGAVESWTNLELISKIAGSIDEVLVK